MSSIQIKGQLINFGEIKTLQNDKKSTTILVKETEGKYPQTFAIDCYGDVVNEVEKAVPGMDDVTCEVNLRSREWQGKYYTSLALWKITID